MNEKRPVKTAFIQLNVKPWLLENIIDVGVFKMVETIQTELLEIVKSIKKKNWKKYSTKYSSTS